MPREPKYTYRGYRLISTYLRLQEQEALEQAYDEAFNRRLKGFHIFCVILFTAFLVDGVLPLRHYQSKITGVKIVDRVQKEVHSTTNAHMRHTEVIIPTKLDIVTTEGNFITHQVNGYEEPGANIHVQKTFLFRARDSIYYNAGGTYAYHYINFHGNFIIWPIISLLISLSFIMMRRFYGSNTLSVIALLNLVPFFSVLYL